MVQPQTLSIILTVRFGLPLQTKAKIQQQKDKSRYTSVCLSVFKEYDFKLWIMNHEEITTRAFLEDQLFTNGISLIPEMTPRRNSIFVKCSKYPSKNTIWLD